MMKSKLGILTILTISIFLGCTNPDNETLSKQKEKIRENFNNWLEGVENGNVDDYFIYTTEDFILLSPGRKPIKEKESLRKFLTNFLSNNQFSVSNWESLEIEIRNDLAIHRYSLKGKIISKSDSIPIKIDRKYLDVLRKNDQGNWKVYLHSFNSNI